jgi:hypothetical protein
MNGLVSAVRSLWSAYTDRSPLPARIDLTNEEITDELRGRPDGETSSAPVPLRVVSEID